VFSTTVWCIVFRNNRKNKNLDCDVRTDNKGCTYSECFSVRGIYFPSVDFECLTFVRRVHSVIIRSIDRQQKGENTLVPAPATWKLILITNPSFKTTSGRNYSSGRSALDDALREWWNCQSCVGLFAAINTGGVCFRTKNKKPTYPGTYTCRPFLRLLRDIRSNTRSRSSSDDFRKNEPPAVRSSFITGGGGNASVVAESPVAPVVRVPEKSFLRVICVHIWPRIAIYSTVPQLASRPQIANERRIRSRENIGTTRRKDPRNKRTGWTRARNVRRLRKRTWMLRKSSVAIVSYRSILIVPSGTSRFKNNPKSITFGQTLDGRSVIVLIDTSRDNA